jgi:N-acyl-D-amino-acid deacylase
MYSYIFRGATVIDGSGSSPRKADVALAGDRIAAIEPGITDAAANIVEAEGLVLAPGFIDIHSHTDLTIFTRPEVASKAFQGVTLEVVGNCGIGAFPVHDAHLEELGDFLHMHGFRLPQDGLGWRDFRSYADAIERLGIAINLAPLIGHAPLRIMAMGMEEREPSAAELGDMRRRLDEALQQGAWGMSTGLIYPPGSFAKTEELIELARVLSARRALYTSHIRNESSGLLAAIEEAITIGRESGARVQVSHLKAMGKKNWGGAQEALTKLSAARAEGIDIAADQYPYNASATTLSTLIPQWAQEGGVARMLERLGTPELKARLAADVAEQIAARDGADAIVVTDCRSRQNRDLEGMTLAAIARSLNCTPQEAVMRLVFGENGAAGAIFFAMGEEDVARIMTDPDVAVGSDGHGLDAAADAGEATHPRSYGTFPRVLGRYVREKKVLPLELAIRKMTSLPASRLGITDRGLVRSGYAADLVLFDPSSIRDLSDYTAPHRYSAGVIHLVVAGQFVIEHGKLTGHRPGRVLRRGFI